MDKHEPIRPGDHAQQQHPAGGEHVAAMRSDAGFSKVGDHSPNQAWSKMSGQPTGGHDGGPQGGPQGGKDSRESAAEKAGGINFADYGDPYKSHGSRSGLNSSGDAPPPSAQASARGRGDIGGDNRSSLNSAGDAPPSAQASEQGNGDIIGGSGNGKGSERTNTSVQSAAAAPESRLTPGSSVPGAHGIGSGSPEGGEGPAAPAGDRVNDRTSEAKLGGDTNRPPELTMPTPEALKSAPVGQLQAMSNNTRQRLVNYVEDHGDKIPSIATHGTNAHFGRTLSEPSAVPPRGELWAAGQDPSRRELGASQRVGDLSVAMNKSMSFAESRAKHGEGPGPVLVYDVGSEHQTWNKHEDTATGKVSEGTREGDVAKYANPQIENSKLLGSVSREQINKLAQKFAPLDEAIKSKEKELLAQPNGYSQEQLKDFTDRINVLNQFKTAHQLRMVLDVVAKSGGDTME